MRSGMAWNRLESRARSMNISSSSSCGQVSEVRRPPTRRLESVMDQANWRMLNNPWKHLDEIQIFFYWKPLWMFRELKRAVKKQIRTFCTFFYGDSVLEPKIQTCNSHFLDFPSSWFVTVCINVGSVIIGRSTSSLSAPVKNIIFNIKNLKNLFCRHSVFYIKI